MGLNWMDDDVDCLILGVWEANLMVDSQGRVASRGRWIEARDG